MFRKPGCVMQVEVADDFKVELNIWDTGGVEKYGALRDSHYMMAQGVLLFFDVTRRPTAKNIGLWYKDVRRILPDSVPVAIIGNKIDQKSQRKVSEKFVQRFLLDRMTNQKLRTENTIAACVVAVLVLQRFLLKDVARLIGRMVFRTRREAVWNGDFVPPSVSYFEMSCKSGQGLLAPLQALTRKILHIE